MRDRSGPLRVFGVGEILVLMAGQAAANLEHLLAALGRSFFARRLLIEIGLKG